MASLTDRHPHVESVDLYSLSTPLMRGKSLADIVQQYRAWILVESDSISGDVLLRKPRTRYDSEDEFIILCGALGTAWSRMKGASTN